MRTGKAGLAVFLENVAGFTVARRTGMLERPICTLPHAALTDRILKAFFEVARELGYGFSEKVCVRALAIALADAGLEPATGVPLFVPYRGQIIGDFYADVVVNGTILLEVKATGQLEDYAKAQLLNYLRCAGGGVGLLLNFGKRAEFKRFVLSDPHNSLPHLRKVEASESAVLP